MSGNIDRDRYKVLAILLAGRTRTWSFRELAEAVNPLTEKGDIDYGQEYAEGRSTDSVSVNSVLEELLEKEIINKKYEKREDILAEVYKLRNDKISQVNEFIANFESYNANAVLLFGAKYSYNNLPE